MNSTTPTYGVQAVPVPTGSNATVSFGGPGDHAACDAEIARLRARCDERDRLISALIAEHPVELGRFTRILRDAAEGGSEDKGDDHD